MGQVRQSRSRYWKQIAVAADRQPRSIYAIAQEIGVDDGALQSAVASMRDEGTLRAKPGKRGQIFGLTAEGKRRLAAMDRAVQARHALPDGARVLLVVDEGRSISPELLHELAAEPTLAWSLRLDGIVRWMAVFESDDAAPVDRVAARVQAAGARPIVGRADAIYNAGELLAYATSLATRAAARRCCSQSERRNRSSSSRQPSPRRDGSSRAWTSFGSTSTIATSSSRAPRTTPSPTARCAPTSSTARDKRLPNR